jgi:predicted enzyme related to lactoylglutathione lyase
MSGEVVHFELPFDNAERAKKFYQTVFSWKTSPVPGMEYILVSTGAVDGEGRPKAPGNINGGMGKRDEVLRQPVVTIMVDDVDAVLKTVAHHGGSVVAKKTPIGDGSMGFTGYFKDPEGNVVGLFQVGKGGG